MKKLTAISLPIASFFALAAPALAAVDVTVNPCTSGSGQGFDKLCLLGQSGIGPIVNSVITLLFVVAVIIALFFLIYGGIKWITSGGDKAGVESARNIIVAALVGLVIVFLSYFILNFILQFFGLNNLSSALNVKLGF